MENKKSLKLTWRLIMQVLSGILVLFYFLPAIKIDAFIRTFSFSTFQMTFGTKIMGESVPGEFKNIFYLVFPVVMLVTWILKDKINAKLACIISIICSVIDLIIWIRIFNNAKKYFGTVCSVTIFTILTFIILLALLVGAILIMYGKLQADKTVQESSINMNDIKDVTSGIAKSAAKAANKAANTVAKATEVAAKGKTCQKCGAQIPAYSVFCSSCGAKYEEPVQQQPAQENVQWQQPMDTAATTQEGTFTSPEAQQKTCPNCGSLITEGQAFCVNCGQKINEM